MPWFEGTTVTPFGVKNVTVSFSGIAISPKEPLDVLEAVPTRGRIGNFCISAFSPGSVSGLTSREAGGSIARPQEENLWPYYDRPCSQQPL